MGTLLRCQVLKKDHRRNILLDEPMISVTRFRNQISFRLVEFKKQSPSVIDRPPFEFILIQQNIDFNCSSPETMNR